MILLYKPMRRADRELTKEEAMELLQKGEYGVLSTVDSQGQPYGVPLSYVLLNGFVYLHCAKTGHKLDNLARQPKVSFCVVGETKPVYDKAFTTLFESVILFGQALLVEDAEEKTQALMQLCQRYLPGDMDKAPRDIEKGLAATAVVKVSIDHITGKRRPHSPA